VKQNQSSDVPVLVPAGAPAFGAPGEVDPPNWLARVRADYREILTELWSHRELLQQLAWRDIRIRYRQAAMGFAWAVLTPLLIVLAGMLVRYLMARAAGVSGAMSAASIAVKALPWAFFVGAMNFATSSLVGNMNLITKIYFPREVLPLAAVTAQSLDLLVGATVLTIALPFLGVGLHASLLWVPVLVVVLLTFTAAMGLLLSCANLFFRDVKYIVQVVLTFGIFFTPIFYEPAMLGKWARVAMLNPIAPIVEGLRLSIVQGHNLAEPLLSAAGVLIWHPAYLAYSAALAVIGLVGGALAFHRAEFAFAEYV
jgi:ABC-type polysaccharide/polyol phosphate export permease